MHLHNVYFSLIDRSNQAKQNLINDCQEFLTVQEGIVSFACGLLEEELEREENDRDFDVSLHIMFENREAHDAYQNDEVHHTFVDRNKDNWAKVRVFDTLVKARQ
ncbi:Dabb family protein [Anaerolineales bacterium]